MSKDKPIHGLDKMPDSVLIKHLRMELGKLSSYVSELEDKLKTKEAKGVKESRLEHLNNRITNLEKELEKSRDRNRELMRKITVFENDALLRIKNKQLNNTTMEITVGEKGVLELKKVFNPLTLITESNEKISICMRDNGFEFTYEGEKYSAQKGVITKLNEDQHGNAG